MSKTVLVTGGHGFLGKVLVYKLQQQGYTALPIHSGQFDLSQPKTVEELSLLDFDFVFHLAGKTRMKLNSPAEFYRGNVDTTRTVLECCRIKKIPLHYVSAYVYGNQGVLPISEDLSAQPNTPYAHSKWMGEEMCRFYARFFSMHITISRPFNIYGPGQKTDFFIPKMIEQIRSEENIKLLHLDAKRDYVYVEDVAEALIAIMKQGKTGNVYNIGTGVSFSCREVIETLQKLMNTYKSSFSENTPELIPHAQANIDKIRFQVGWEPKISLKEGLTKCIYS